MAAPPGKKVRAAYAVRLDGPEQRVVLAPMDLQKVVRAATPEDEERSKAESQGAAGAEGGPAVQAEGTQAAEEPSGAAPGTAAGTVAAGSAQGSAGGGGGSAGGRGGATGGDEAVAGQEKAAPNGTPD